MTPLLKKLNYKHQREICILNAPSEFEQELSAIKEITIVQTDLSLVAKVEFVLTFVRTEKEINDLIPTLIEKLIGDSIVWFAYPKGTSKKYKNTEINRDSGWNGLRDSGLETVRQVAIDEDWSALRFRKIEFIKNMPRKEKKST